MSGGVMDSNRSSHHKHTLNISGCSPNPEDCVHYYRDYTFHSHMKPQLSAALPLGANITVTSSIDNMNGYKS